MSVPCRRALSTACNLRTQRHGKKKEALHWQYGSPSRSGVARWGQGKPGHLLPFLLLFSYASAVLSPFHALLTLPLELSVGPLKSSYRVSGGSRICQRRADHGECPELERITWVWPTGTEPQRSRSRGRAPGRR